LPVRSLRSASPERLDRLAQLAEVERAFGRCLVSKRGEGADPATDGRRRRTALDLEAARPLEGRLGRRTPGAEVRGERLERAQESDLVGLAIGALLRGAPRDRAERERQRQRDARPR